MQLSFQKYQGTGNDFILIDNRGHNWQEELTTAQIKQLCHRRFGIGADGLILLSAPKASDFKMIYYNSDGRESTMCGNGGRCLVAFARHIGAITGDRCTFEAIDGLHQARISGGQVELEMIRPQGFQKLNEREYWIDTGSPHFVQFSEKPVGEIDVNGKGSHIRYSSTYAEMGGTNVNFVNVVDSRRLKVRTYERGVEGETLSCGTGVTACAYAYLRGYLPVEERSAAASIHLDTPGGTLRVSVSDLMGKKETVMLCGPALRVFSGSVEL